MARYRVNDIELTVEQLGAGPPVMLLHGFTHSSRTWGPLRERLAGSFTVIAVDLIGHGESATPDSLRHYALEQCADDLAALLTVLGMERTGVLGYSMGGRVALQLALRHREHCTALLLESTSPGIEDEVARQARREADAALAARIEQIGVEAFLQEWEALPLFAGLRRVPPALSEQLHSLRLRNSAKGLASSLRGMGTGRQRPLWSQLPDLAVPVLVIAGQDDGKYCEIGLRMTSFLPCARSVIVPESGHTVHLEADEPFIELALGFFRDPQRVVASGDAATLRSACRSCR
ncbi:MAG: 2-succinyl-6-hydroxy-2,4-cyclohexadiene-1-carboxylate synthase [Chloroflexi bacterium]|nr:2-succinyl-6-hydroxy-2,4-cyclohexadiene-1-carboxylate synthase [Chloroflexota bacterium]